jgi:hypothetical protein
VKLDRKEFEQKVAKAAKKEAGQGALAQDGVAPSSLRALRVLLFKSIQERLRAARKSVSVIA